MFLLSCLKQSSTNLEKQRSPDAVTKTVWLLVLGFFIFLPAVSSTFCIVLDPRGRLGDPGWKVGSACEEFEDNLFIMQIVHEVQRVV